VHLPQRFEVFLSSSVEVAGDVIVTGSLQGNCFDTKELEAVEFLG
jgi:hypothetical protein